MGGQVVLAPLISTGETGLMLERDLNSEAAVVGWAFQVTRIDLQEGSVGRKVRSTKKLCLITRWQRSEPVFKKVDLAKEGE